MKNKLPPLHLRWDEPMDAPAKVRQEREAAERRKAFAELRAWVEAHIDEFPIVSVGGQRMEEP